MCHKTKPNSFLFLFLSSFPSSFSLLLFPFLSPFSSITRFLSFFLLLLFLLSLSLSLSLSSFLSFSCPSLPSYPDNHAIPWTLFIESVPNPNPRFRRRDNFVYVRCYAGRKTYSGHETGNGTKWMPGRRCFARNFSSTRLKNPINQREMFVHQVVLEEFVQLLSD